MHRVAAPLSANLDVQNGEIMLLGPSRRAAPRVQFGTARCDCCEPGVGRREAAWGGVGRRGAAWGGVGRGSSDGSQRLLDAGPL